MPEPIKPPFQAYSGDEPFIFVSYSHRDCAQVYPDLLALHQQGYRIWYDDAIDPGSQWREEIASAIIRCHHFLVYLSPASVESRHVRNEVYFALQQESQGKPGFLGVFLEETRLPDGLSLSIGSIQHLARHQLSAEDYAARLRQSLRQSLPEATCESPVLAQSSSTKAALQENADRAPRTASVVTPHPWRSALTILLLVSLLTVAGYWIWHHHANTPIPIAVVPLPPASPAAPAPAPAESEAERVLKAALEFSELVNPSSLAFNRTAPPQHPTAEITRNYFLQDGQRLKVTLQSETDTSCVEALLDFLQAETVAERLTHLPAVPGLDTLMNRYYARDVHPALQLESLACLPPIKAPDGKPRTQVLMLKVKSHFQPIPVMMSLTSGQPLLDWPAFIEFSDSHLEQFMNDPSSSRSTFHLQLEREHDFDDTVPDSGAMICYRVSYPAFEQHQVSVRPNGMLATPGKSNPLFVRKDNPQTATLNKDPAWGDSLCLIAELAWHKEGGRSWVEIEKLLQLGWELPL